MLLRKRGPSTEGVFRKPCNTKNMKDIREQLNGGQEVDMESQQVVLLVGLLKVRPNACPLPSLQHPKGIRTCNPLSHHCQSLDLEFSEGTSWQPAGV